MSTNEQPMKWFRVIDNSGQQKEPVDVRAKDETDACVIVARQWFGQLPGCCMDRALEKIIAVPYTDDGRITRIEGMAGLPGKACLPPSGLRNQAIVLSKEDSEKLAEALLNPPEPSQELIDAARRYKERTQE